MAGKSLPQLGLRPSLLGMVPDSMKEEYLRRLNSRIKDEGTDLLKIDEPLDISEPAPEVMPWDNAPLDIGTELTTADIDSLTEPGNKDTDVYGAPMALANSMPQQVQPVDVTPQEEESSWKLPQMLLGLPQLAALAWRRNTPAGDNFVKNLDKKSEQAPLPKFEGAPQQFSDEGAPKSNVPGAQAPTPSFSPVKAHTIGAPSVSTKGIDEGYAAQSRAAESMKTAQDIQSKKELGIIEERNKELAALEAKQKQESEYGLEALERKNALLAVKAANEEMNSFKPTETFKGAGGFLVALGSALAGAIGQALIYRGTGQMTENQGLKAVNNAIDRQFEADKMRAEMLEKKGIAANNLYTIASRQFSDAEARRAQYKANLLEKSVREIEKIKLMTSDAETKAKLEMQQAMFKNAAEEKKLEAANKEADRKVIIAKANQDAMMQQRQINASKEIALGKQAADQREAERNVTEEYQKREVPGTEQLPGQIPDQAATTRARAIMTGHDMMKEYGNKILAIVEAQGGGRILPATIKKYFPEFKQIEAEEMANSVTMARKDVAGLGGALTPEERKFVDFFNRLVSGQIDSSPAAAKAMLNSLDKNTNIYLKSQGYQIKTPKGAITANLPGAGQ